MKLHWIALLAMTGVAYSAPAADIFDIQAFVDKEIAAGAQHVIIPPGTYRVAPKKRSHLTLKNLKDVEIVADNVEMICTETTRAITIEKCKNLTLRGLTIDYDPLPFTQGKITDMAPDKSWLEFELFEGFPDDKLTLRIEIFDQTTNELKRITSFSWRPITSLGDRRYRVSKEKGYKFDPKIDLEEVGDILVTNNSNAAGGENPHAIVTSHSSGITLENIRLYASNCFSYLEYYCDGTTYRNCSIDRRPPEQDLKPRAYKRLRSSNVDAFHSKHALRGPQILNCTAKFMGDDAVNICGEYYMIMGSKGNIVRILSNKDFNLAVGTPAELVSYTGERIPDAKVTAIADDGVVHEEEIQFVAAQQMNNGTRYALSRPTTKAYAITLDRVVDLPRGSVIASMNHMGNGFLVQNCDFGMNRSRGILIKASHGAVINNRLHGTWGPAILVTPEWWWLESGSSNDVKITGNKISDCRDIPIAVRATGGNGLEAPAGAHNRISITGNSICKSPFPAIFVSSTRELILSGNNISAPQGQLNPWVSRGIGLKESQSPPPVMLSNCEEVVGAPLTPAETILDTSSK